MLGQTGLQVSPIAFGCARLGASSAERPRKELLVLSLAAHVEGINRMGSMRSAKRRCPGSTYPPQTRSPRPTSDGGRLHPEAARSPRARRAHGEAHTSAITTVASTTQRMAAPAAARCTFKLPTSTRSSSMWHTPGSIARTTSRHPKLASRRSNEAKRTRGVGAFIQSTKCASIDNDGSTTQADRTARFVLPGNVWQVDTSHLRIATLRVLCSSRPYMCC
jgi:hypothetical protein